ncbi:MAG TPA: hypothetical protein VNT20_10625 [Flavisolibacter sp.]|nr:hypothetical protein [Flavisolibacter sp.]
MRVLLFAILLLVLLASCHRNKCNIATVTQSGTPCSSWGIKLGTQTYPADSIPDNFKREGLLVCVNYELYSDNRMCPCCGGTWARIKSIRHPDE